MSFSKPLFVIACVAFAACYRNASANLDSVKGMRFSAQADVVRARIDLLRIRFTAKNESRDARQILIGHCGVHTVIEIGSTDRGSVRVWNFQRWQRLDRPTFGSPLGIDNVCVTSVTAVVLEPGSSTQIDEVSLPLQLIVGDSLPPGRYQIRGKPGALNYRGGLLNAGVVDLSVIRQIRTVLPVAISNASGMFQERGVLMGQVVDSVTGLELSGNFVEIVKSGFRMIYPAARGDSVYGRGPISTALRTYPRIPFLGGDSVIVRRAGYAPVKLAVKLSPDSVYETLIVMQRDTTKIIMQRP